MSSSRYQREAKSRVFSTLSEFPSISWKKRILLWFIPLAFFTVFFLYPFLRISALAFSQGNFSTLNLNIAVRVLGFTFYQAALSTLITLALGFPSAVLFARFDFWGKSTLRALTAVPFLLPTVVVAASFNSLLGPRGLLSSFSPLPSIPFTGALIAILIAHVFYNTT